MIKLLKRTKSSLQHKVAPLLQDTPEKLLNGLKARFGLCEARVKRLEALTDLQKPAQLFPFTRAMKRKIICHLGPTNSGKTYAAIEELKRSANGVYCAPLRLLAQEMFDKLNGAGHSCALRTGEVTKMPKNENESENGAFDWNAVPIVSCTVEMLNMRKMFSVAVIDEIQMVADPQRGWAFTQALLGCNAETIYVCGEMAAKPLMEKLMEETGESVEFVQFDRLTPLQLQKPSSAPIKYEAGDCIVTFSRKSIFKLKDQIEQKLAHHKSTIGKTVAVVYGALPAENRTIQANKFNEDFSGVDILVASDAIGMGLNLYTHLFIYNLVIYIFLSLLLLFRNIKRIIFDTLYKFDGTGLVPVPAQQIRQISGRAGRFNTKHEIGLVTCSKTEEFSILENALNDTDPQPYKQAGIAPTFEQIDRIRHEFAQFDLADILDAFTAFAKLPAQYFLSDMRAVRRLLELLRGLDLSSVNLEELFLFLSAPVKVDNEECASTFLFVQPHTKKLYLL